MNDTITIRQTNQTAKVVPLITAADGLGVTEDGGGYYGITHLASGMRVWPQWDRRDLTRDGAIRAWRVALQSGIDWTQDAETLKATYDADSINPLRNRMRLAAWPPRRARWYKGDQKRRMLPYKAESKRMALREASGSGSDVLRSMWNDLWVYKRRGAMWGILPAVVRQPCTRFGVTRESREVPS